MKDRTLVVRGELTNKEIVDFIFKEDTENLNSCLVLNGGPGLGKTKQTMKSIKQALTDKHHKNPKILVVESRSATVDQISENYKKEIESIGGITVKQRIAFMNMVKNGEVDKFDWVIIDECHGLFSEASFAEDASFIANWIRCGRTKQHIIFITANDEYFGSIFKNYFSDGYSYSQLFDNPFEYNSSTYVKSANYFITNKTKARLLSLLPRLKNKKGIIFFQRASSVCNWYFSLLEMGFEAFPIVSLGNQTNTQLSTRQEQILRERDIDYSHGQAGLTMADLERAADLTRVKYGKQSVRQSLIQKAELPDDIEILLATDTLQEGVSIVSHVDYILIEGYTEVEVRQKLGRYRGNLDELYVFFNRQNVEQQLEDDQKVFQRIIQLLSTNDQVGLAEMYGEIAGRKWQKKYVLKRVENGQNVFYLNEEAYEHHLEVARKYLNSNPQSYMRNLLSVYVKNPETDIHFIAPQDFHNFNLKPSLEAIVTKWAGVPLKSPLLEDFIQDFEDYGITDERGRPVDTLRKCTNLLRANGIKVDSQVKTTKELKEKYPECDLKAKVTMIIL